MGVDAHPLSEFEDHCGVIGQRAAVDGLVMSHPVSEEVECLQPGLHIGPYLSTLGLGAGMIPGTVPQEQGTHIVVW